MKNISAVLLLLSLIALEAFAEENCYVGQVWGRGEHEVLNIKAKACEVSGTGLFYLKDFGCQNSNLTETTCFVSSSYGCKTLQFWGGSDEKVNDDLKQFKVSFCPDSRGVLREKNFICVDHDLSGANCTFR